MTSRRTRTEEPLTDAQRRFAEDNVRLLYKIADKTAAMFKGTLEADDCIQIGAFGYMRAVQTYKEDNGTAFSTYAGVCIRNEILRHLRLSRTKGRDDSKDVYMDDANPGELVMPTTVEEEVLKNEAAMEAKKKVDAILQKYPRNKQFADLLMKGYSISEAARELGNTKQALHRRMRTMRDHCKRNYMKEAFGQ